MPHEKLFTLTNDYIINMDYTTKNQVTEGIRIIVRSMFIPEQSNIAGKAFVFAYRITIRNESDATVQLLQRHWDIVDGYGAERTVDGEGVVGVQPVLPPNHQHTYVSGCVFPTPIGTMEGYYTMERLDDGTLFEVKIPKFLMEAPFLYN